MFVSKPTPYGTGWEEHENMRNFFEFCELSEVQGNFAAASKKLTDSLDEKIPQLTNDSTQL
jgi:hypothetical protein